MAMAESVPVRRSAALGRGDARGDGTALFFLDWRHPTVKAEQSLAALREAGTIQPDDLVVSAVWYGYPQPPSRWVSHQDLTSAEKDRLLVVAQQALGADWIASPISSESGAPAPLFSDADEDRIAAILHRIA